MCVCVIIAKSVFEENGKYYPQVYLKDCFFECDYADNSYVCCKTPLKYIDCVDYGLFLFKKVLSFLAIVIRQLRKVSFIFAEKRCLIF